MKHILFNLLLTSSLIMGCSSVKNVKSSTIQQGICGMVTEVKGNRMPSPDAPNNPPKGILTTVFVYETTLLSQVARVGTSPVYTSINTKLVSWVMTDSTGFYEITLPVGNYSLFVQLGKGFYANLFDNNNLIAPFKVEEGKVTKANLVVSDKASF